MAILVIISHEPQEHNSNQMPTRSRLRDTLLVHQWMAGHPPQKIEIFPKVRLMQIGQLMVDFQAISLYSLKVRRAFQYLTKHSCWNLFVTTYICHIN